jgi:hypothetical protein
MTETSPAPGLGRASRVLLPAALVALALARIWMSLCVFVGQEWNDVRLRAAWLVRDGLPLYPGFDAGPATTWIYGPVTPVLLLPATLWTDLRGTMLAAAALNAAGLAAAIALASRVWLRPAGAVLADVLLATACALLLLPEAFLVFIQADNATLACGLVSLACLQRAGGRAQGPLPWCAAGFAAAALFAKWHGAAVPVGSLLWLALCQGRRPALQYLLRLGVACLAGVGLTLLASGSPHAAWETMVLAPARLPAVTLEAALQRGRELLPLLGTLVVLPALVTVFQLRGGRWRSGTLGLPMFAWLSSLPLGFAGAFTLGGHYNSLHGAFYLVVPTITLFVDRTVPLPGPVRRVGGAVLAGLILVRLAPEAGLPWRPQWDLPDEASALASSHGEQVWLPWRPLAVRLATGRHDHDEDGLLVRVLARRPVGGDALRAHLPPRWSGTFLQHHGMNWNIALASNPPGWLPARAGRWVFFSAPVIDSGVGNPPPASHLPARP